MLSILERQADSRRAISRRELLSIGSLGLGGLTLGLNAAGKEVSLTAEGKVAIDGKVYKTAAAYSKACGDAALLSASLDGSKLSVAERAAAILVPSLI